MPSRPILAICVFIAGLALFPVDAFGQTGTAPCCPDAPEAETHHASDDPPLAAVPQISEPVIYTDFNQPLDKRINDLLRRMSIAEKIGQLVNSAPEITRLNIPRYDYWNECLHGVARAGNATVFPQAIGMAATWDSDLLHTIGDTIATEARAKYHEAIRQGNHKIYYGLTFWTPNINIFRDPRWGRGQETYGEDPYLTSRLAVAFITGLQGNDPQYIKALACAKHYAVHSGPESSRHIFDARPSEQDLYDTYLPHFHAAVTEGKVGAVMGAYNRLYGEPCCASMLLLTDLLRDKWKFTGHVVSDCDAVSDIYATHKVVGSAPEAAAKALKAGCDLNCGTTFGSLSDAFINGSVSESDIDRALGRVLKARFQLGLFDPEERVPYAAIPFSENDSPAHAIVALQAARESLVLLKNDGTLPLRMDRIKRIAVIGPNADSVSMLVGNYNGNPSHPVSILQGIKDAVGDSAVLEHSQGCPLALPKGQNQADDDLVFQGAIASAKNADVVIYVGGLSAGLEGEEMNVNAEGFSGGDRTDISLPRPQLKLLQALIAVGKPVVVVNCSGSAVAMDAVADRVSAIIQAWYPGQSGGTAVGEALVGKYNPGGKLPVTFYSSASELPAFDDYSMRNRTYRFFTGALQWPFGYGLSYTTFEYGALTVSNPANFGKQDVQVKLTVKNTGKVDGDEVVQAFVGQVPPPPGRPARELKAFKRVHIDAGKSAEVTLTLQPESFRYWDSKSRDYTLHPGRYRIEIGTDPVRQKTEFVIAVSRQPD